MERLRRAGILGLALLGLVSACGPERSTEPDAPGDRPRAAAAPGIVRSEAGLYRVHLRAEQEPARLHALHAWIATISDANGAPVDPSRLAVGGGMPQHAHGFVTEPRVTRRLGPGEYRIEGVKFHMSGDWIFELEIVGPAGPDVAVVPIRVEP